MSNTLLVLLEGAYAGELAMGRGGGLRFTYDEAYRGHPGATPLSVAMPLVQPEYRGRVVANWISNLLPDNELVLNRWATQFQVSAGSPFRLLEHVGRDVAGAVQFVRPDDVDQAASGVDWLSPAEFASRVNEVRADPAAWTPELAAGMFSLAGAQAKIALRYDVALDRWGLPYGDEPTTHILKPYSGGLPHQALNEHLSLALARRLGLPAARSRVLQVEGASLVCVERYDRLPSRSSEGGPVDGGAVRRVHQEDMCQALGMPPSRKYESDGGPGIVTVLELLARVMPLTRANAETDRFLRAQALAWATAATDAHAKNYGLLLAGDQAQLTPLYDLHSAAPYFTGERRGVRPGLISIHLAGLAMRVGGARRFGEVTGESWSALAGRARLDPDRVLGLVSDLVCAVPAAVEAVTEAARSEVPDVDHAFLDRYRVTVTKQARSAEMSLAGRGPRRRAGR